MRCELVKSKSENSDDTYLYITEGIQMKDLVRT